MAGRRDAIKAGPATVPSASQGRFLGILLTLVLMVAMSLFAIAGFVAPYLADDVEAQESAEAYGD